MFRVRAIAKFGCLALVGGCVAPAGLCQVAASLPEIAAGQQIADVLRVSGAADIGIVADAQLSRAKESAFLLDHLADASENAWLVKLTGEQIKSAIERSFAFYPISTSSLLHFSGCEVVLSQNSPAFSRVISVLIGGTALIPTKKYSVAMGSSLAKGSFGYFSEWNFVAPERVIAEQVGNLISGKKLQPGQARWQFRD
jgi:hypothetical protein